MNERNRFGRRRFLGGMAAGIGALTLGGCDKLSQNTTVIRILDRAEALTRSVQRAIIGRKAMATEFAEADISPDFRSNGTHNPEDADYQALARNGFADWRLDVGGLVERPM